MDAHLTDLQQSALESLLEVTGGECERDVVMSMLESVDWDVQVSIYCASCTDLHLNQFPLTALSIHRKQLK